MHSSRVLVVEDDSVTRLMLEARLRAVGHAVQGVPSGEDALKLLATDEFALLLTDMYLDTMDGVRLMSHARAIDPDLELIVLTGAATIDTAIAAATQHVHVYLRKPVAPGELEQHVTAALERRQQQRERAATLRQVSAVLQRIAEPERPVYSAAPLSEPPLRLGRLAIDTARRSVTVDQSAVGLSASEFELLLFFARRPDTVLSPRQLAAGLLDYRCELDEARDMFKTRVHRLRQKIERDPSSPTLLVSVRGAGYMLNSAG